MMILYFLFLIANLKVYEDYFNIFLKTYLSVQQFGLWFLLQEKCV